VYVLGGGGSGGGCYTTSDKEKVSSGGAAGGVAFRRYSVENDGITSATISIGAGGAGVTVVGTFYFLITGRDGGTTTFTPNSGTAISATGGSRGFASKLGTSAGQAASDPENYAWGYCASSSGGTGSGGESNYTGGIGVGFNIGGDGSAVSGGGSPNLGSGGVNGSTASAAGFASTGTTGAPTKPSEWGSDVSATFRGSAGVQHSSLSAGSSSDASNYGAGSGGTSSEVYQTADNVYTGDGSQGAIFVTYYEINT